MCVGGWGILHRRKVVARFSSRISVVVQELKLWRDNGTYHARCKPATTEAAETDYPTSLHRCLTGIRPRSEIAVPRTRTLDQMVLVIADIIAAHCAGTRAREEFVQACVRAQWAEAQAMVEGMLAEPWYLVGYQERRLREFLKKLLVAQDEMQPSRGVQITHTEFA